MMATNSFMDDNVLYINHENAINPITNAHVKGGNLTALSLHIWDALTIDERTNLERQATALFEADVEVGVQIELLAENFKPLEQGNNSCSVPSQYKCEQVDNRDTLIRKFVEWIECDPFQPNYRQNPYGQVVCGWASRLKSYFWPSPQDDWVVVFQTTRQFEEIMSNLVNAIRDGRAWDADQQEMAVEVATEIFAWGGVPQNDITAELVRKVAINAITGKIIHLDAPMNSGWTKFAAFASAYLESSRDREPQVIWDSRVATAITHRFDRMCAGNPNAPRLIFPDVGYVNGRGGTRPRMLSLRWPNGYQKWPSQFAGSQLVKEIRDVLNAHPDKYPMPLPTGVTGPWTIRGVEMVLFMDGY